ncbi:MAG: methionine biosynthesis protein MetW [Candidatus Omnitrophota bacterium]
MIETPSPIKFVHQVILELIEPNSKVLDLGCGDGTLLSLLIRTKNISGTGIEINEQAIYQAVAKGLTVSHADIDSGLVDYSNKRFDYVILNESLQEVLRPKEVILEACRVGKKVIVGIPNFCYWTARLQIFLNGRVPVTKELPHEWDETPNLRFLSIKDFRAFCRRNEIRVLKEIGVSRNHRILFLRNLFANTGVFLLEK